MSARQTILDDPNPAHFMPPYARTRPRKIHSPLLWLNLSCLDAPIVAVAWQWLFARTFHVSVGPSVRIALFLTAWVIYLADRLADARSVPRHRARSLRQQWCQRHQRLWLGILVVVACADGVIILRHLETRFFAVGLVIGLFSLAYLGMNYSLGKIWRILPIKELFIGVLFALGTILMLLPGGFIDRSQLIVPAIFFAALCSLNCINLAAWERELDREQGKESLATWWPGLAHYLRPAAALLTAACISASSMNATQRSLFFCIAFSAALLGLLDLRQDSIAPDERIALADLVLLTPLLICLRWG